MSWTLYVHTAKGETFTFAAEPQNTVAEIREKLQGLTKVPPRLQQLLYQGRKLENDRDTLSKYRLQNYAKILLIPQKAAEEPEAEPEGTCSVPIKTLSGKSFVVQAKLTDTVEDVCSKIEKKEGIPLEQQQLIYGGRVLDRDTALDQYSIQQGSTLHVIPALSQRKVFLKLPTSSWSKASTVPFMILLTEPVSSLCKKIMEKFKIPAGLQQLYLNNRSMEKDQLLSSCSIKSGCVIEVRVQESSVPKETLLVRTPKGQQVQVECSPGDTIASIKEKIHATSGIEPRRQLLLHAGRPLEDAMSADSYNLFNQTTVHLLERAKGEVVECAKPKQAKPQEQVEIFIRTLDGKTTALKVSKSDSMADIKTKIQATKGLACAEQSLMLKGEPLDDSVLLRDCNIELQSTFYLTLRPADRELNVFVKIVGPAEKTLDIQIPGSSTVSEVKEKILASEGTPVADQKLFLGSRELSDRAPLSDYNIRTGTTLNLQITRRTTAPQKFIYVRNLLGKTVAVEIMPSDTVGDVKTRISNKEGIPVSQQRLIFRGQTLSNEELIKHCNIEQQSSLQLALEAPEVAEEKLISVYVRTVTGKILTVEIPSTAKVIELKKKVQTLEGLLPGHQKLILAGVELANGATLDSYNLNMLTTLQLIISVPEETLRNIFITTPLGKVLTVGISSCESVRELKGKIGEKVGVVPAQQKLIFRGQELGDNKLLVDYGIEKESHLVLMQSVKVDTVSVRMPSSELVPIGLQPGDTVATIKYAIQQLKGLPFTRQNLLDADLLSLEDSAAVSAGDILTLVLSPVPVSVVVSRYSPSAKSKVIAVSAKSPEDIQRFVAASLDIVPESRLKLFHNGRMLTTDSCLSLEPGDVVMMGKH